MRKENIAYDPSLIIDPIAVSCPSSALTYGFRNPWTTKSSSWLDPSFWWTTRLRHFLLRFS